MIGARPIVCLWFVWFGIGFKLVGVSLNKDQWTLEKGFVTFDFD